MIRSLMNKLSNEWIIDETVLVSLGMVFDNQSFAWSVREISEACDWCLIPGHKVNNQSLFM